ncbi:MAG TPA: paraquat-inducible protein A [Thermoanaerobaculia bacterium]|jgi:paraquat-inducible protein A|nr:paraquat-inducible protein A [Thermoanaerobaculia bacterium]
MIPDLPPGATAECHRCDRLLAHARKGVELSLACAIAVFLLLPPAFFLPLFASTVKELVYETSRLVSSVPVIYSEVWFPFAFGFLFFAFLFPAVRAILQILVLGSVRFGWRIPQMGRWFRWSEELRMWSMTEVVCIAGLIAYFRASVSAEVDVDVGAWSYFAVAALSLIGERALDRRAVWNAILSDRETPPQESFVSCEVCELTLTTRGPGDPCPRCGAKLEEGIRWRFAASIAAIAAAIPLSLPGYDASVMINQNLTGIIEHTVLGTVQLLADRGYWQLGVIVLVAGVAIPAVVIVGMSWLLIRVRWPQKSGLVIRTRVYRILHRLVRWPMAIPFVAAIAAPIIDYRGIDDIVAGPGATPLFAVIALVVFAVGVFEPRLMWKAGNVR